MKFKSISKPTKSTWDRIASDYTSYRQLGESMNELVEIPAMKNLVGNVENLIVLDAGCGFGEYSSWAKEQGAKEVVGIDISEKMIKLAKENAEKEGVEVKFFQGDLSDLAGFGDGYFDLIMSSIVVGYFGDLEKYFSEFARVLKKGGRFIFSDVHPMQDSGEMVEVGGRKVLQITSYAPARPIKGHIKSLGGEAHEVDAYYRPLSDYSLALKDTGFLIEAIVEPGPDPKLKEVAPEKFELFSRIPLFVLIKAVKK